jgi:hypothetical protein
MMEAASTSETPGNGYQTTQRYNPEDSHLDVILFLWWHSVDVSCSVYPCRNVGNTAHIFSVPSPKNRINISNEPL